MARALALACHGIDVPRQAVDPFGATSALDRGEGDWTGMGFLHSFRELAKGLVFLVSGLNYRDAAAKVRLDVFPGSKRSLSNSIGLTQQLLDTLAPIITEALLPKR